MERLLDNYTIVAGDVAVAYAGRGWNPRLGNWLTVSGSNLGSSIRTKYRLLDADMTIQTSAGLFRSGVVARLFIMHDPTNPSLSTPWFEGMQSKGKLLFWAGNLALDCGFFWRIQIGGLVAGDIVSMGVGYA